MTMKSPTPSLQSQASEGLTSDDWVSLLVQSPTVWAESLTELDGKPTVLEPFQIRYLNDKSLFRIVNKARQIGFSTVLSIETLHSATTRSKYKSNIVSINQDEASDKVTVARDLYYSIPDDLKEVVLSTGEKFNFKPDLYNNSTYELAFHWPPNVSEIHSQPSSSAIRGGSKDIYFDEFAHIRDATKLFHAALPAISRGDRRFTIISTPLGQSGLFYDICSDADNYPNWSRHTVPWWEFSGYIKPGLYQEALAECPHLDTIQRLDRYGTDKMREIFKGFGNDVQAFATEYEATFVDELASFYPWSLIVEATDDRLPIWKSFPDNWEPEGSVSIGIDLAKARDESVFTVVESINRGSDDAPEMHHYVRFIHATQDEYEDQWRDIKDLIRRSHATRITIDQTGLGQVFVEKAKSDPDVASSLIEGVVFTNPKKERWATSLKGDLQGGKVHWPRIADLSRQVHGINRVKSEAGFYKFAGKRDDYFWSLCLAIYGEGRTPSRISYLGG